MSELEDHELLADYARNHSEASFSRLAERHLNLVYSAALRFTGDPHHAQEITQAVFIILARKAGVLSRKTLLPGWLYETARLTSANFMKSEARRKRREQEAYMQSSQYGVTDTDASIWEQISPLLDEALARLAAGERDALVLRFFERKTTNEVAAKLGLSTDAAQKRMSRAVEKMRAFFVKRGVVLPAATIIGVVTANSVQAAPAGVLGAVTTVAAKGAAASGSAAALAKAVIEIMAWAKLKMGLGIGVGIIVATTVVPAAWRFERRHFGEEAWRYRFEDTYALHSGEVLRHFGKPFSSEREAYYFNEPSLRYHSNPRVAKHETPGSLLFVQGGGGVRWSRLSTRSSGQTLGDAIEVLFGPGRQWIRGDTDLLAIPLEGDWLVRSQAPRAAVLKEFSAIVERETGRKIRLEPQTTPTEVLVARGTVDRANTRGARPEEPPHMDLNRDSRNFASGDGDAPAGDFLGWYANWLEVPIVSGLDPVNQNLRITWTITSHRRVENPNLSREVWVEQELARLKSETGLSLKPETRPTEVWFLTEKGH
jgi:RNA polymerase sigma factor (sigma-70 family)